MAFAKQDSVKPTFSPEPCNKLYTSLCYHRKPVGVVETLSLKYRQQSSNCVMSLCVCGAHTTQVYSRIRLTRDL